MAEDDMFEGGARSVGEGQWTLAEWLPRPHPTCEVLDDSSGIDGCPDAYPEPAGAGARLHVAVQAAHREQHVSPLGFAHILLPLLGYASGRHYFHVSRYTA